MSELEITDTGDGLDLRVRYQASGFARSMAALGASGFSCVVVWNAVPSATLVAILGVFAWCVVYAAAGVTKRHSLTVTSARFVTARNQIIAADVHRLEYQEGDSESRPAGLYAVTAHRSICLLPDVNDDQALEASLRIQDKFPHFRKQWSGPISLGTRFLTLDLSDPPNGS